MRQGAWAILLAVGLGCGGTVAAPTWQERLDAWTWGKPVPAFDLVDQDGRTFSLDRYRHDWLVVGWVFTRCSEERACPMTMARLVALQERWAAIEAEGRAGDRRLSLLALTLDPDHDTPERLASYGRAHGADPQRLVLATGPRDLLAEGLPSMFSILSLPDAERGLTHTVKIVLLRPGLVFEAEWKDDEADPDAVLRRVLSDTPAR